MEEIINKLKELRAEKGLSVSEVARRTKTERARISEIENGRGGLTLKRLYEYAQALGLKVTIKFE